MVSNGSSIFREAFAAGIRPERHMTVSQWADAFRRLPEKTSAETGRYRTSRTPYMREPMDSLTVSSRVHTVVIMSGTQLGKTEVVNNWIGYTIHQAPAPMMVVVPRTEDAKRVSKSRIDPMIAECAELRERVSPRRSRDADNSTFEKHFPGGVLILTGGNSAAGLRGTPVQNLAIDEVDGMRPDTQEEGDPLALAERRITNWPRHKKLLTSTPTIHDRSRIEREYEATDRCIFLVPCPDCGAHQLIDWKRMEFDRDVHHREYQPGSVRLRCEACAALIAEHHKTWMLERGLWLARNPERSNVARGFWISSLYSPLGWYSWDDAVRDFLRAKSNPDLLRVFVNTVLAETWRERGDAPDWNLLYSRRERYRRGTVPKGGLILTAGIDVQRDRVEVEVVAWGAGRESWSIDMRPIVGKFEDPETQRELERFLSRTWRHESGAELRLRAAAIDSSDQTSLVYDWVRHQTLGSVFAVKGQDNAAALIERQRAVEVAHDGKKARRGIKVWMVGVSIAKSELYAWLRLPVPKDGEPFAPGFCHFPEDYGDEYFRQLTAEEVVPRIVRGYRKYLWEKTRERNEALDCRVYARAAAALVGIDHWQEADWLAIAGRLSLPESERPQPRSRPRDVNPDDDLSRWR